MQPQDLKLKWKFSKLLEQEGIKPYRLMQEVVKHTTARTVYKWASDDGPERINFEILLVMLAGLYELTGKKFTQDDVFEVIWEEPGQRTQLKI